MATSKRASMPPALSRPRMPLSQRAKIFIPFDPLKGYQDALREKEREAENRHRERVGNDMQDDWQNAVESDESSAS